MVAIQPEGGEAVEGIVEVPDALRRHIVTTADLNDLPAAIGRQDGDRLGTRRNGGFAVIRRRELAVAAFRGRGHILHRLRLRLRFGCGLGSRRAGCFFRASGRGDHGLRRLDTRRSVSRFRRGLGFGSRRGFILAAAEDSFEEARLLFTVGDIRKDRLESCSRKEETQDEEGGMRIHGAQSEKHDGRHGKGVRKRLL